MEASLELALASSSIKPNLPLHSRTVLALTRIETTSRTPAIAALLSSTLLRGVWRGVGGRWGCVPQSWPLVSCGAPHLLEQWTANLALLPWLVGRGGGRRERRGKERGEGGRGREGKQGGGERGGEREIRWRGWRKRADTVD